MTPKEKDKAYKAKYYQENKERMREISRAWGKANPEKLKQHRRKTLLKTKSGITPEIYKKMFEEQQGCCAICGRHQTEFKRTLDVDHDHVTGKVRKLLCIYCNTNVGVYELHKEQIEQYLATIDKE